MNHEFKLGEYMRALLNVLIIIIISPITIVFASENTSHTKIVMLNDDTHYSNIGMYLYYLVDSTENLTINDIQKEKISNQFIASQKENNNFGFTNDVYWFRVNLSSETQKSQAQKWYLELPYPHYDHIEVYIFKGPDQIHVIKTGDLIEFNRRKHKLYQYIVDVTTHPKNEYTIFFRIQTKGSLPMKLMLWQPKDFYEQNTFKEYIYGLFFGMILIMVFYNLFLFFSLKDHIILYYIIYILSALLFQLTLTGHGFMTLWPNQPWLNNIILPITISLMIIGGILFSKFFLNSAHYTPLFDKLMMVIVVISCMNIFLTIIVDYSIAIKLSAITAIFWSIILSIASIICYYKGCRHARFYLIAWSVVIIGSLIYSLRSLGLFPVSAFSEYIHLIGMIALVLFLSIAIADRINLELIQSEKVQKEAILTHKNSLSIQKNIQIAQEKIAIQLEEKSENLLSISEQLSVNTDAMKDQSFHVSDVTEKMTSGIKMIAAAIEEMSSNVGDISQTTKQISNNIDFVASAIEKVSVSMNHVEKSALEGSNISQKAMSMTVNAKNTISSLANSADEIDQVTVLIKRISDKTNLLALNAAIEAAAAGNAGKGFAVVANSIQKFADQSAEAAEDIATKITSVQTNSEETIKVITNISSIIDKMNLSSQAIAQSVKEQTKAVNDISVNAAQATSGTQNIVISMEELSKGTNDISSNTSDIASGADTVMTGIRSLTNDILENSEATHLIKQAAHDLSRLSKSMLHVQESDNILTNDSNI